MWACECFVVFDSFQIVLNRQQREVGSVVSFLLSHTIGTNFLDIE